MLILEGGAHRSAHSGEGGTEASEGAHSGPHFREGGGGPPVVLILKRGRWANSGAQLREGGGDAVESKPAKKIVKND